MDKRYQVFVSSTYEDLREERQQVMQALLELDCIPAGMELFPAADEDQWTLIRKVIDDCDYYIVIVGGRYGSVSDDGISYTQKEYEYATECGKPIMGFVHKDSASLPVSRSEKTKKGQMRLAVFTKLVRRKLCREWSTPGDLRAAVSTSVAGMIKRKPASGWVRWADVQTENRAAPSDQPNEHIATARLTCGFCKGTGCEPAGACDDDCDPIPCSICNGRGVIVVEASSGIVPCKACDATGRKWQDGYFFGDKCEGCHGLGCQALFGQLRLLQ